MRQRVRPDGRLAGRTAIVTGAGPRNTRHVGIGQAISVLLAREGANVVLVNRDPERAAAVRDQIADEGGRAFVCAGDVSDPEDAARIVRAAVEEFGGLHVLVNNAAALGAGSIVDTDLDDWHRVLDVNLTGAMLMSRFAIPRLVDAGGGSIVHITSISSLRGYFSSAAYHASKAGLHGLMAAMAVQHGKQGIRVNCVVPGHALTAMSGDPDEEQRSVRNALNPLGTEGTAWDVGWAAVYLASDEARWVTGVSIPVDGGTLMPLGSMTPHWLPAPATAGDMADGGGATDDG